MHANYAVGYLWALKDLASENEIQTASATSLKQFEEHILNVQEMVTKKGYRGLSKVCGGS